MGTDVARFDPSAVQDRVKARVKEAFVDLIDDEAWTELVRTEMKRFFEGYSRRRYAGDQDPAWVPSELQTVVREVMREHFTELVKQQLQSDGWRNWWDENGKARLGQHLQRELVAAAPEMFAKVVEGMVSGVVANMSVVRL